MKVFSLPSQMRRNVEFAQSLGFEVPDAFVFTEVFTGTKGDRPGLNKIEELIEARQIDALIVYNADRFFRNRIEAYLMRKFMQKYNVEREAERKGVKLGAWDSEVLKAIQDFAHQVISEQQADEIINRIERKKTQWRKSRGYR